MQCFVGSYMYEDCFVSISINKFAARPAALPWIGLVLLLGLCRVLGGSGPCMVGSWNYQLLTAFAIP